MASTVRLLAFALVGGSWGDDTLAGLWCWSFVLVSSTTYASYGARLLIFFGDLVWFALSLCLCFFALVGGAWSNGTKAGLWYWNVNEASSNAWTNVGARLLISFYKYRDLMCLSA